MRATQMMSTVALVLGCAAGACAQDRDQSVDVSQLPVDLSRIHRQLRQSTTREAHDGLNLQFFVDVYGKAPAIQFYTKQDNLQSGPVPYGAPTHSQIVDAITPQEYRAPAADFTAIARWLARKTSKK